MRKRAKAQFVAHRWAGRTEGIFMSLIVFDGVQPVDRNNYLVAVSE
ncbi:MAG: hypothetical protein DHS20C16_35710 [Phycisphaerae bacterium]|nr:MAG: hypothetical protein DHS20C16_35710 [Phycisphaerae bacterium]